MRAGAAPPDATVRRAIPREVLRGDAEQGSFGVKSVLLTSEGLAMEYTRKSPGRNETRYFCAGAAAWYSRAFLRNFSANRSFPILR